LVEKDKELEAKVMNGQRMMAENEELVDRMAREIASGGA
jgi:hypothetical protein